MNPLLAASVLVASMVSQAALAAAVPGSAAPDFALPDITGKPQKLSDYRGKYVVIEWFNQGCPFVQKHYESGNMQGLQKRFMDKGVVWLAVSSNNPRSSDYRDPQQMKGVMKDWKMTPTAFMLDEEGKVGRDYGARATPHMFVVDPKGQVIYAGAIDDKATWRPEDVKTARNFVAQALDESLAGKPVTQATTAAYGCSVKY
ncbi:MAG: thioredoxin family protein [Betaproteobacteria bacterium]|nr:thioredoxin family protein [Betaproteobacteria bacterium]